MATEYERIPITEEEAVRILNQDARIASGEMERIPLTDLSMDELWEISKTAPPDVRHKIMVHMYGGKTPIEPPTPLESIGHGAQRVRAGLEIIPKYSKDYLAGGDRAEKYLQEQRNMESAYQTGRGPDAGIDWWSLVGEMGALSPFISALAPLSAAGTGVPGILGMVQQMLGQGAAGAISGAIPLPDENQTRIGNALMGGAAGAAMPPLMAGTSKFIGNIANRIRERVAVNQAASKAGEILDDAGRITADRGRVRVDLSPLRETAERQMKAAGALSDDMLRRQGLLKDLGFVDDSAPMIGQLTQDPALFTAERNLAKLGGPGEPGEAILMRLQNQAKRFQQLENRMVSSTGAKLTGRGQSELVGEQGVDAIHRWWARSQKEVGRLYNDIEKAHGDLGGIDLSDFIGKMKELAHDESLKDVTNSVANRLRARGVIDDLGEYTGKTLTVSESRGLRTWISNLGAVKGPARFAKGKVIESLDDAVIDSVGDDFFKTARDAARERFRQGETRLVRQVLQGNLQPNQMMNRVKTASTRNLEEIKNTFTNAGDEGLRAWDEIRGQTLFEVFNKNIDGSGNLGAGFIKDLEKIGNRKGAMLWPERWPEILKMKDAVRALNVEPNKALSAINYSNTAATLLGAMPKIGISGDIVRGIQTGLKEGTQRRAAEFAVDPMAAQLLAWQQLQSRVADLFNRSIPGTGLNLRSVAPFAGATFVPPAISGGLESLMQE